MSRRSTRHLTVAERETRREAVWGLRVQGKTHRAIAAELGLDQRSVANTMMALNRESLRQISKTILARKAEQVQQLEYILQEAMEAWQRSKEAGRAVSRRVEPIPGITPAPNQPVGREIITTKVEDQDGDPRYLETAMKALADIRKVLDMEKVPLVGEGGTLVMHQEIQNTTVNEAVMVIDGSKSEYIAKLRQLRGDVA